MGAKVALIEAGGTLDGTGGRDLVSGAKVGGKEIELVVESSDATPDVAPSVSAAYAGSDLPEGNVSSLSRDRTFCVRTF